MKQPQLASNPDEPLKLADGRLVYPGGRVVDPRIAEQREQIRAQAHADSLLPPPMMGGLLEIPSQRDAQRIVTQTRRKLVDLPEVPRTMNGISAVISYTLFGLDDSEIAIAVGLTEKQVGLIKMTDAYASMYDTLVQSIMDAEANDVRDMFRQHSRTAANVLVDSLHNGGRGDRIVAAKDFLDRAGHRPADVVEHRMRVEGGLVIEIIKRDEAQQPPMIDVSLDESEIANLVNVVHTNGDER
jgi:hypothetical protein